MKNDTQIRYEQSNPVPGRVLRVPSVDVFVFHMHKAFGMFPVELSVQHIERLEGMDATYAAPSPFRELIGAIRRLGSIRVWAERSPDAIYEEAITPTASEDADR